MAIYMSYKIEGMGVWYRGLLNKTIEGYNDSNNPSQIFETVAKSVSTH